MRNAWSFARWSSAISTWLGILICCGIAALAWFGYRAAREWQRSSALLVERRANEIATTLVTALTRDMRAVQTSILDAREWDTTLELSRSNLIDLVAGAFARYPYPEEFFSWQSEVPGGVFFARSERLPRWLAAPDVGRQYPVKTLNNASIGTRLRERIEQDVAQRRTHSIFEMEIDGHRYQVVARPMYAHDRSGAVGGFAVLVNLDWTEANYLRRSPRRSRASPGLAKAWYRPSWTIMASRFRDCRQADPTRRWNGARSRSRSSTRC